MYGWEQNAVMWTFFMMQYAAMYYNSTIILIHCNIEKLEDLGTRHPSF